jgi:hypothetical protein
VASDRIAALRDRVKLKFELIWPLHSRTVPGCRPRRNCVGRAAQAGAYFVLF